ncbi:YifB family Mg chelatase-like AAA ATPase [Virgisporangium ochraceum]
MGYAQVRAVALVGMVGQMVVVESDVAAGLPSLVVTGLPDAALTQARDRVRAAVVNSGEEWPQRRLTVNLLPAHLPKHGSSFDLAVAASLLAAAGAIPADPLREAVLIGELGLDGTVRPVRGVLPAVVAAMRNGLRYAVVPAENAAEAALVPGIVVRATDTLARLIGFLRCDGPLLDPPSPGPDADLGGLDLADVLGQDRGRRAVELAAAGGHNLALFGPPGAGKTMLAQRLPTVLPPLSDEAALEVTAVHSLAGALPEESPLIRQPPFQAPHHTTSVAALVGGGSGVGRPGALSRAHHGVLFMDEAPEFSPAALEALRQPLEEGVVRISRSRAETVFPARVQLVLASNPCPCARPGGDQYCECSPLARRRYLSRLSGPLLDRIDLQVKLSPARLEAALGDQAGESSEAVASRVAGARAAAAERWGATNAGVPSRTLRDARYRLPRVVSAPLAKDLDRGLISARGHDRVLRVAWTMCDLDGRAHPELADVCEALDLRRGTR